MSGIKDDADSFDSKCKETLLNVISNLAQKEMLVVFLTSRDIYLNSLMCGEGPRLCNSKAIKFAEEYIRALEERQCAYKGLLKKIGIISLIAISLFIILLIANLFVPQFYVFGKMWLWSIVAYAVLTFVITATDLVNYFMIKYEINDILKNVNLSALEKMFPKIIYRYN